ncbi:MAG: FKBP-type peptidyl-prolyl cis-trans isomerase [Candidatus Dormibacteraeota bacterium]|nr:FKBP-type peptidyl-prolyl cis-trans isomerase [Candidatus Dormibacteraeota bacterium]
MRLAVLVAGAALLLAGCGYPDATANSGPAATTQQTTPTPLAGSDNFNEGSGQQPTTFPDGLQFIDLKVGTGPAAAPGDTVRVHYTGWLANGNKFDSSRDRGQPFDVTLGQGQVIPGWDEGIPGMKVGGRRKLIIPPALAYGDQGQPPTIPAKATLYFTVELVAITAHASPSPGTSSSPAPTPSPSR